MKTLALALASVLALSGAAYAADCGKGDLAHVNLAIEHFNQSAKSGERVALLTPEELADLAARTMTPEEAFGVEMAAHIRAISDDPIRCVTIMKSIDDLDISPELKEYLRSLGD